MATLRDIRRRITSVQSTQQITKAMKMVAAVKLRRAQEAVEKARPYAKAVSGTVSTLAAELGPDAHPLLKPVETVRNVQLVSFSSDRGLCGSFNSSIIRLTERYMIENSDRHDKFQLSVVGRKSRDAFKRNFQFEHEYTGIADGAKFAASRTIADALVNDYLEGKSDRVLLLYNEFVSAVSQRPAIVQLLPIIPDMSHKPKGEDGEASDYGIEPIYEPGREALLEQLIPLYVRTVVFRALLESSASEHGARMTAMENATNNARDMLSDLKLLYNRARQASITKELMEIISGAESIKE